VVRVRVRVSVELVDLAWERALAVGDAFRIGLGFGFGFGFGLEG